MTFTKARAWPGRALKGTWEVSYKIDGVRAFFSIKHGWTSRNGKPLYNLPVLRGSGPVEGYEAYNYSHERTSKQNFKATIQAVRAKNKPERALGMEHLYTLYPIDSRLQLPSVTDPTVEIIRGLLTHAIQEGHEGIILRQGGVWYKLKPVDTMDVRIISLLPGEGKHTGRLGAVITSRGKVGTGFSDAEREEVWANQHSFIGKIIEVSYMELTEAEKFRLPRFERFRDDKDETDDHPIQSGRTDRT